MASKCTTPTTNIKQDCSVTVRSFSESTLIDNNGNENSKFNPLNI